MTTINTIIEQLEGISKNPYIIQLIPRLRNVINNMITSQSLLLAKIDKELKFVDLLKEFNQQLEDYILKEMITSIRIIVTSLIDLLKLLPSGCPYDIYITYELLCDEIKSVIKYCRKYDKIKSRYK